MGEYSYWFNLSVLKSVVTYHLLICGHQSTAKRKFKLLKELLNSCQLEILEATEHWEQASLFQISSSFTAFGTLSGHLSF